MLWASLRIKSSSGKLWTVWVTSLADWSQSIAWHLTLSVCKHRPASSIMNFYLRANAKRTYFSFWLLLPFQLSGAAGVRNERRHLYKADSFVCSPIGQKRSVTWAAHCHCDKGTHSPASKGNSNLKMASRDTFASGRFFTPWLNYPGQRVALVCSSEGGGRGRAWKIDFSAWPLM